MRTYNKLLSMAALCFWPLYPDKGRLAIDLDGDLVQLDTQAILCLDADLLRRVPSAPFVACEFEGQTAYVTCGYFMRYLLLDHAKFIDRGILRSNWSRTGAKPEVRSRMLRLTESNGLVPAKDIQWTLLGLVDDFSGLDSSIELIINADDIEVFEYVPDDTP